MPFPLRNSLKGSKIFIFLALAVIGLGLVLVNIANPTVREVSIFSSKGTITKSHKPYRIINYQVDHAKFSIELNYHRWQNAYFFIEPVDMQVNGITVMPAAGGSASVSIPGAATNEFRHWLRIDFAPYLQDGLNHIEIDAEPKGDDAWLEFDPKLFGAHWLSTLGCLLIYAGAAWIVWMLLQYFRFDRVVSWVVIAAFTYNAYWLHQRANFFYTPDMTFHLDYLVYLANHWLDPYSFIGGERHHPPTYYYLAGAVYTLFGGVANPISAVSMVRALSLLLYMVFCLIGLKTLEIAITRKTLVYYLGVVLVMFWPVHIMTSTNVNNDMLTYPMWAAAFYYLVKEDFPRSIIYAAITLMVKSNGYLILAVIGVYVLVLMACRRLPWRALLARRMWAAYAMLLFGGAVNFGRIMYAWVKGVPDELELYLGGVGPNTYPSSFYFSFNPWDFVARPYLVSSEEPGFLNYLLKSFLYDPWGVHYPASVLPNVINAVFLLFLVILVIGIVMRLHSGWRQETKIYPCIIGVVIPILGLLVYTAVEHIEFAMNLRFALPLLVSLIILFCYALETLQSLPRWRWLYYLGLVSGAALPALALILHLAV